MGKTYAYLKVCTPFPFTYKCSKCGTENYGVKNINTTGQASQYGYTWTKKSKNKLKSAAAENTAYAHANMISLILKEAKQKKYKKANLRCRCTNCNHMEPWAKYNIQWLETHFVYILGFIGLIRAFLCFSVGSVLDAVITTAITALLIALIYIGVNHRYRSIEKEIEKLPQTALPVFSIQTAQTLSPNKTENDSPQTVTHSWRCNCGKMIQSSPCPYCGEEYPS